MPTIASRSCSTPSATSGARSISRPTPQARSSTDWHSPTGSSIPSGMRSGTFERPARTAAGPRSLPFRSRASVFRPSRASGASTSLEPSRASSRTTAGRAPVSTRSFFRCPKRAKSRTSAGSRRASAWTCVRFSPASGCTWQETATTTSAASPDWISSTASRRASGSPRRSTPTSARRKSTRARSTSRDSRCCSPRSARSFSKAPACSALRAPAPKHPAAFPAPAPTCTRFSAAASG